MQENILEKYPDANIGVYVVWVPRVSTGERFGVAELVVDDRAAHYWDEGLVVPAHYGDASDYDVFYAFGPDAAWGDPPDETGRPVLFETARLGRALAPYLQAPGRYVSFADWENAETVAAWKNTPEFAEGLARVRSHVEEFAPTELEVILEVGAPLPTHA